MKKWLKIIFILIGLIGICLAILLLPTYNLKTRNMLMKESHHFICYYEPSDEKAAADIQKELENSYDMKGLFKP